MPKIKLVNRKELLQSPQTEEASESEYSNITKTSNISEK